MVALILLIEGRRFIIYSLLIFSLLLILLDLLIGLAGQMTVTDLFFKVEVSSLSEVLLGKRKNVFGSGGKYESPYEE